MRKRREAAPPRPADPLTSAFDVEEARLDAAAAAFASATKALSRRKAAIGRERDAAEKASRAAAAGRDDAAARLARLDRVSAAVSATLRARTSQHRSRVRGVGGGYRRSRRRRARVLVSSRVSLDGFFIRRRRRRRHGIRHRHRRRRAVHARTRRGGKRARRRARTERTAGRVRRVPRRGGGISGGGARRGRRVRAKSGRAGERRGDERRDENRGCGESRGFGDARADERSDQHYDERYDERSDQRYDERRDERRDRVVFDGVVFGDEAQGGVSRTVDEGVSEPGGKPRRRDAQTAGVVPRERGGGWASRFGKRGGGDAEGTELPETNARTRGDGGSHLGPPRGARRMAASAPTHPRRRPPRRANRAPRSATARICDGWRSEGTRSWRGNEGFANSSWREPMDATRVARPDDARPGNVRPESSTPRTSRRRRL